jgi:hypothetical protein
MKSSLWIFSLVKVFKSTLKCSFRELMNGKVLLEVPGGPFLLRELKNFRF